MSRKKKTIKNGQDETIPQKDKRRWWQSIGPWGWLIIAGVISSWLIARPHLIQGDIPFGDGRAFAQRAIELHGYLHSGKWHEFMTLLSTPSTVTIFPVYLVFLMLPSALATGVTYGLVNILTWHACLAIGVGMLLRSLRRVDLALPVFLMVICNNYALDASYYYYMDMTFGAASLVVLALFVRNWEHADAKCFFWAGMAASLLLLIKPGGSFIFLGLYWITFLGMSVLLWWHERSIEGTACLKLSRQRIVAWFVGFLPVALCALFGWTAAQRIVEQWVTNQRSAFFQGDIVASGVLRAFYFPLCLSFYYSILVVVILLVLTVGFWVLTRNRANKGEAASLSRHVMTPVMIVFLLVWGGLFSFVMTDKVIRSLVLMLPLVWIWLFVMTPLSKVPARVIWVFAILLFSYSHVQFATGWISKTNRIAETYALTGDWWNRQPMGAPDFSQGQQITKSLVDVLLLNGVKEGKVAVGTEMLYWNSCSLNWLTQVDDYRAGKVPKINFCTAVNSKGYPIRDSMEGADALLLILHPRVQYSQEVYAFNVKVADYAAKEWRPRGIARVEIMKIGNELAVVLVMLREKLQGKPLNDLMQVHFPNGYSSFAEAGLEFGRRLTLSRLLEILMHPETLNAGDR